MTRLYRPVGFHDSSQYPILLQAIWPRTRILADCLLINLFNACYVMTESANLERHAISLINSEFMHCHCLLPSTLPSVFRNVTIREANGLTDEAGELKNLQPGQVDLQVK